MDENCSLRTNQQCDEHHIVRIVLFASGIVDVNNHMRTIITLTLNKVFTGKSSRITRTKIAILLLFLVLQIPVSSLPVVYVVG
jgi:hypothetical protein